MQIDDVESTQNMLQTDKIFHFNPSWRISNEGRAINGMITLRDHSWIGKTT